VNEFYGTVVELVKDDDLHMAWVETRSRFHPHRAKRVWRVNTDTWGGRRFGSTLLHDAPDREGVRRQMAVERKAAEAAVLDRLNGKVLPADPFIGTAPEPFSARTYPRTVRAYAKVLAHFTERQCRDALEQPLPKTVAKRVQARLQALRAEARA
jgi:hypothetical protein